MSCYNAADWLVESVESVLCQTFTDFEFVIIDDGSTDNSLKILERYALKDDRIVFVPKGNTGLADSLNVGLRCARGEWVARMDADDICEPNRLEKQVAYVSNHPNVVFVGTGLTIIDESGFLGAKFSYPAGHAALLKHLLTARRFPPHASAFYRRKLVLNIGGYRGRIPRAEDYDLWLRLSEHGDMACIQESLMRIRKHSGQISLSDGGRDQIVDCRLAIISYLLRKAGVADVIDEDELTYHRFVEWVKERLQSDGYFEFTDWINCLRSQGIMMLVITLVNSLFHKPSRVFQLVRERATGDQFAYLAVEEWLASSDCISNLKSHL
jgi:glycosyltransferase involved in cell wall biosynthesis